MEVTVEGAKMIIEISQLTKTYGMGATLVKALRGISLKIHKGEFVAIVNVYPALSA